MKRPTLADVVDDKDTVYRPTAEEIAAACLKIQEEWTDEERARRQFKQPLGMQEKDEWIPRMYRNLKREPSSREV